MTFTGQLLPLLVLMPAVMAIVDLLPPSAGEDFSPVAGLSLVLFPLVVVMLVRFVLTPLLIVDMKVSALIALRKSWALSRGRSWRIVRLMITFVCSMFVVLFATRARPVLTAAIFAIALVPIFSLAYTHLYLGMASVRPVVYETHVPAPGVLGLSRRATILLALGLSFLLLAAYVWLLAG
jgi:hypothetical protein